MAALSESEKQTIIRLYTDGISQYEIARRMGLTRDRVHGYLVNTEQYKQRQIDNLASKRAGTVLSTGYDKDGCYTQEKLLNLKSIEGATPEQMLELHGLDSSKWRIKTITNNFYEMQAKGGDILPLYQSKLIAEPCTDQWAAILECIASDTVQVSIERQLEPDADGYLVVAINDTHFGRNKYADVRESQERILSLLDRGYKETVIYLAGDLFDADNFKSTTASGTQLDTTDLQQSWIDLCAYAEPIIARSIERSSKAQLIFTRGNHSESMEWAWVQYLSARYPQLDIDGSADFHKAILLGSNFIGFSHGYKRSKNIPLNLAKQFSELWGLSTHQEIIIGHEHAESTDQGAIIRVLPTRVPRSEWENENNFALAHQAWQCFEYSETDIKAIHYV